MAGAHGDESAGSLTEKHPRDYDRLGSLEKPPPSQGGDLRVRVPYRLLWLCGRGVMRQLVTLYDDGSSPFRAAEND